MTSTLRARVLDALPGYRQQEHRHDQLRAMHQNIPTAPGAFANDYLERIAAAADNDGRDLDTLATSFATDRAAWAAAAEFNGLISQARDRAWHAMQSAEATGAETALNFLRSELDTLAAEVNEHRTAVENHPNTAEQAIATGTGQAQWNLVDGLISRYNEIRNEHRRYVKLQSDGNEPRGFVFVAQSAKFLEVDPYWLHRRAATNGRNSTDPAIAAWFASIGGAQTEYARNGIWPTMPRNRWLLTVTDNHPWLPDAATINAAYATADDLFTAGRTFRNAYENAGHHRRLEQLHQLGAITDCHTPAPA
ncbi:MAG: hypothetical protein U0R77_14440 [Mycolicibacterium insubricum]|nr:hypothetical protein [Mycobacterium sp.]